MAKTGKTGIFGLLAFAAIILNAVAWVVTVILNALKLNSTIGGILTGVASLFLLVVTIYVSYDFAKRQKKVWRIIWWVLVIVSILAVVCGVGVNVLN